MKIIHKFSPGIAVQNFKLCGSDPISATISGLFGYASTEETNETNEDIAWAQNNFQRQENQLNRDYNTREAEKARNFEAYQAQIARDYTTAERLAQQQWQKEQWDYQQKNQIQLQMQGAREAGLNPNVAATSVMSANGGNVSSPTGANSPMPSGPMSSYSGGISPTPYQAKTPADAFASIAQGLSSIASAKEKGANVGLIEKQIENMAVDTQYKQVLTDGVKLANNLQRLDLKYREKKLVQDLAEQVARTTTIKNQGELHAATIKIQDSIKQLNEALANKHTQDATLAMLEVGSFDKRLQSALKLQGAQIKESNARAFEAGQHGKLLGVETLGQEFKNSVLKIDSEISAATAQQKLYAMRQELLKKGNLDEKQKIQAQQECEKLNKILEMYRKHPNKAALDAALDNFNEHFPLIGGFIKAFK